LRLRSGFALPAPQAAEYFLTLIVGRSHLDRRAALRVRWRPGCDALHPLPYFRARVPPQAGRLRVAAPQAGLRVLGRHRQTRRPADRLGWRLPRPLRLSLRTGAGLLLPPGNVGTGPCHGAGARVPALGRRGAGPAGGVGLRASRQRRLAPRAGQGGLCAGPHRPGDGPHPLLAPPDANGMTIARRCCFALTSIADTA